MNQVGKPIHDFRPAGRAGMRRYEIAEDPWERIKGLLPGQDGDPGVTAQDNRLFVNAVLWIAKTGAPWRDLPERFGPWNSVWRRFDRWAKKGVWLRVFDALKDPDLEWLILDSTVIRAHQHAAGAGKKGAPTRRWAGPGAASAPSCTSPSTAWGTPSSSS
jgi:transposase